MAPGDRANGSGGSVRLGAAGYRHPMTIPEDPTPIEPQPEPQPPSPVPEPEPLALS
jgi:hypothetical protein